MSEDGKSAYDITIYIYLYDIILNKVIHIVI